jgi:hypothetical protein
MRQYDTIKARFEPVDRGSKLKPAARIRIGTVAEFTAIELEDSGDWRMQTHDPIWDGSGIGWVRLSDLQPVAVREGLSVSSDQFFAHLDDQHALQDARLVKRYKGFVPPSRAFRTYEDLKRYVNAHQSPRVGEFCDFATNPGPFIFKSDIPETTCLLYSVVDKFIFRNAQPGKMIFEYQIPVLDKLITTNQDDPEKHLKKAYYFPVWGRGWRGVWGGEMEQLNQWRCYLCDIRSYGLVEKGVSSDRVLFADLADAQAYVESWVPTRG